MVGIIKISGCSNSSAAVAVIAANEFPEITLSGEPDFIGSAGEGDTVDDILSFYGQAIPQTERDRWEYYKCTLLGEPIVFLKAWLHWNGNAFDSYLNCVQASNGTGFASHPMPYLRS